VVVIKCECNRSDNKSDHPTYDPLLFVMEPRTHYNIQSVPGGKISILGGRSIGHFKQKSHWGILVSRINVENGIKYAPTTVYLLPF
jgi:hypothetical protein